MTLTNDWKVELPEPRVLKEWFPCDWALLRDHPLVGGRPVVADLSVRNLFSSSVLYARERPELFPDIEALVQRCEYASSEEIISRLSSGEDLVWLSSGSSLTRPAHEKEEAAPALRKASFYAVAAGSIFNAGYAGVYLYEAATGRRKAFFYGGRAWERPEEP